MRHPDRRYPNAQLAGRLLLLTLAIGCTAPRISTFPPEAIQRGVPIVRMQRGVVLAGVDGKRVEHGWFEEPAEEAELLPGNHVLEVGFSRGNAWSTSNILLKLKADQWGLYEIRAATVEEGFWSQVGKAAFGGSGEWTAWIVDLRTSVVVSGVEP